MQITIKKILKYAILIIISSNILYLFVLYIQFIISIFELLRNIYKKHKYVREIDTISAFTLSHIGQTLI